MACKQLYSGKTLEYANFLKREWRGYTVNPVVKISYDNFESVNAYRLSIWDYIKANIDTSIYIKFWIDEFYVQGLQSYQVEHFSHESLVNGYDENSMTIYMISIKGGKPEIQIDLDSFLIAQKMPVITRYSISLSIILRIHHMSLVYPIYARCLKII